MKPFFLFVVFTVFTIMLNSASAAPIHDAVKTSDLVRVQELLNAGADVNSKDEQGYTPLHWAVDVGSLEISSLLLEKGADVNAVDNERNAPLHIAADKGRPKAVALLIEKGAEVNFFNQKGLTPLYLAVQSGRTTTVTVLLDHNAQVEQVEDESSGADALSFAIIGEKINIIKLLLSKGASFGYQHVSTVIATHNLALVQFLFKKLPPREDGSTSYKEYALVIAAQYGDHPIFDFIMSLPGKLDFNEATNSMPPYPAAENDQKSIPQLALDLVERIFADDPEIKKHADQMLWRAIGKDNAGLLIFLLSKGANVNQHDERGDTPLHLAAQSGSLLTVGMLVERGAKVNAVTEWGNTAMMLAIPDNHFDVVKYLAEHGASVSISNTLGNTPLHFAAARNLTEMSALFIKQGAKVNIKNKAGNTPLHQSVRFPSSFETAQLLIKQGAKVNEQNALGYTALHYAAERGSQNPAGDPPQEIEEPATEDTPNPQPYRLAPWQKPEGLEVAEKNVMDLMQFFLQKGAKLQLKNTQGLTALDLARTNTQLLGLTNFLEGQVSKK